MKAKHPDSFALLAKCGVCVQQAASSWETPLNTLALQAECFQKELLHILQQQFVTPLERGDLYLPACLCIRQIRSMAQLQLTAQDRIFLSKCAEKQKNLLCALNQYQTPDALYNASAVLRTTVRRSEYRNAPGVMYAKYSLFDSFAEMADLIDYILLKNN